MSERRDSPLVLSAAVRVLPGKHLGKSCAAGGISIWRDAVAGTAATFRHLVPHSLASLWPISVRITSSFRCAKLEPPNLAPIGRRLLGCLEAGRWYRSVTCFSVSRTTLQPLWTSSRVMRADLDFLYSGPRLSPSGPCKSGRVDAAPPLVPPGVPGPVARTPNRCQGSRPSSSPADTARGRRRAPVIVRLPRLPALPGRFPQCGRVVRGRPSTHAARAAAARSADAVRSLSLSRALQQRPSDPLATRYVR
ncbi:hypothetical protein HPB50_007488 [Hyalomma asiaticum]|uniref:Uncharacterized protein n=1 Tax=Hyalomma asiaticum TaxID=266040 RepID=A0ACB7S876_HYAAI|nr:hypothetical protein HPB50_007488 [Hyalomma asiaticum]